MIDTNTGFPEVAEGYFWRVEALIGKPYVALCRRDDRPARWWRKPRHTKVGGSFAFPELHEWNPEAAVLTAAERVLEYISLEGRDLRLSAHLLGDYPPKKLEVE